MAEVQAEEKSGLMRKTSKIQADKELTLKQMELKAQAQTCTNAVVCPPLRDRDAKSPKLPVQRKDEPDSYLLRFERRNAK